MSWDIVEVIITAPLTGRTGHLQASALIILPSWACCFTAVPLCTRASRMHLSGVPLWPRGPMLPIMWEWSSLVPALHVVTRVFLSGPFSWTVIPSRVSTPLLLMRKAWLPFGAFERSLVAWCRAWPPISWVATKMPWGRWSVTRGVTMKRWTSLTMMSLRRTMRWWLMLDLRGAGWPRWRQPSLAMVWFHFRMVRLKGILILGPPVIKTWLPLLSHQRNSSDRWGSSSTSGFPPVKWRLCWVGLGISSTSRTGVVIAFIVSSSMTISIRSNRTQEAKTGKSHQTL